MDPTANEEKIVKFVMGRVQDSTQSEQRRKFIKEFDTYKRAYNGEFKQKLPDQYSQFFIRLAFSVIDTMESFFYEALLREYPMADFTGRFSEDQLKAEAMQNIMDYEIYHRNFIERQMIAMGFGLKYGITVGLNYWRYQVGKRKKRNFEQLMPGITLDSFAMEDFIRYDNPSTKIIDPRRFYPDRNAGTLETENGLSTQCTYAAHDEYTDFSRLVLDRVSKKYFNLEKLSKDKSWTSGTQSELPGPLNPSEEDSADEYRDRIKLTEYWGPVDIGQKRTDDNIYTPESYDDTIYRIIIANEKYLIHFSENPYAHNNLPYQIGNVYKSDDSIYGPSALSTIMSNQEILNTLVNLRLENIHTLVHPSPIVSVQHLKNKDHFNNYMPGKPIEVMFGDDLDKVMRWQQVQDIGQTGYMEMMNRIERLAHESSAANPESMGMHPNMKRSATEVATVMNAGTARFKKMTFIYATSWLQPVLRQYVQLIQQFGDNNIYGAVLGDKKDLFVKYSPEEIQGEYDVMVRDATVTNKELVSQAYANLLASLAPWVQDGSIDKFKLLQGILKNVPLIPDADEMLAQTMTLSQEEIARINSIAPQVMQIIAMAKQKGGAGPEGLPSPSTPGSGFNGGQVSMGPQTMNPMNNVRIG